MIKTFLLLNSFLIVLAGCAGPGTTLPKNSSVADADPTTVNAHFSATLDGVKITGDGVDEMQLQNAAFIYPDKRGGKKIIFLLYSKKNAADDNVNYSFRFDVPDKTGSFQHPSTGNENVYLILNTDLLTGSMARYTGEQVTVNIVSLTATRIRGTFSGIFKLGADTPRAEKKQVTVTDGVFDIPFSTGNIKPE